MKASIAGQFMDRHEGRTVVLNDVDALAVSSLDHLGDIDCDIALKMTAKRLRGRFMLVPRSGTVVINPTKASRALVENWVSAAKDARYGDTDESALTKAMAETSGLRVTVLASPVSDCIRHDCASLVATKASHLKRAAAFALDPIRAFAGIARGSSPA
ncbi:hypothetical protein KKP04_01265 [Rhodomicrobium sp. Az07]|uniref:hypothetical protein n=1 Tax=Rhodomicrobium sp. Az07 TaxID=2839034 RepID=UPI001BE61A89|nr:hypothetical protein [Rhodomicrobium sp. Az07]